MDAILQKIIKIKEKYPELTLDNVGYEYLKPEIREKYKNEMKEVLALMQEMLPHIHFVEFNNFKPTRDNNTFSVRCQTKWSESFTGVEYFDFNALQGK